MPFVKHRLPCPACGGSDPVSVNDNGSGWCFSCGTYLPNYSTAEVQHNDVETEFEIRLRNSKMNNSSTATFNELTDRKISLETAKKYGVKSTLLNGKIDKHYYPYYNGHELSGTKIRKQNKEFAWTGSPKEVGLFGENLFKAGGNFITLTEGECDGMAAYELLGSKWPVVSIKSGAQGGVADVKNSLEYLESFDCVVINFDNDKYGKEAAQAVAKLLTPKKAKIMTLPVDYKDANDMLRKGRHAEYVSSFWDAKLYTPSGVLNMSEQLEAYQKLRSEKKTAIPYPWYGLNKKLEGMRAGELVTLTGGTGLGKSSVTRELEHWLIKNTEDNVGIVALEENWLRTADGILSIEANARLYIDQEREQFSPEEIDKFFDILYDGENKNRVWVHAHFGTNSIDEIFNKIRFMIIACDCKWIVVDHLHMLVSALSEGDERRSIDNIMTRLRSIVEETNVGMILVSHLRRVDGNKGHENGVEVSLSHLRGSQSIAQLSDCVIALERNQQSDDIEESNTTRMRVLKSRYTGDVGLASHLLYDRETGRLREVPKDQFEDDDNELLEL